MDTVGSALKLTIPANRFDTAVRNAINVPGMLPNQNTAGGSGANGNPTLNYFDGRTVSDNYDLCSIWRMAQAAETRTAGRHSPRSLLREQQGQVQAAFGTISTARDPRIIQLALKLMF